MPSTPQKPVFFDGRQLRRVSAANPIDTETLEPDVVTTDGLHPFVAPVAGVDATADADLTTRRTVDRRIADGFWGGPVQAILSTPPGSPGAEQRWIVGASPAPTGAWVGHAKDIAVWRNSAWVFIPAVEGLFVFNRGTHSYVHYTGTAWVPILGTGTVTSVGLLLPPEFDVTLSPVTTLGDLTAEWVLQETGHVFAGPVSGDPATPGFRALVETDIPSLSWNHIGADLPTTLSGYGITDGATSGAVGSSGLTMSTDRLLGRTSADVGVVEEIIVGAGLSLADGVLSAAGGTVTSVGLDLPSEFTITNSPVTGAGTLTGAWSTQAANRIFAGPASGENATPGFRALASDDIPGLSWSKITSGTPTTIAGYGITDAAKNGAVGSSGLTVSTARLLGRFSDGSGAIEEISIGTGLDLSAAGVLSCTASSAALPEGKVGFGGPGNVLTGSVSLTYASNPATGGLTVANTTESISATSGALVVGGGAGVGGALYVGSSLDSTSTTTGALVVTGGLGVGGASVFGKQLTINAQLSLGSVLTINQNSNTALNLGGAVAVRIEDHEDTLRGRGIEYVGGFGMLRSTGRAITVVPWLTVFVCTGVITPPALYDRYTVGGITYAVFSYTGGSLYAFRLTPTATLPPASGTLVRTVGAGDANISYTLVSSMTTKLQQGTVHIRSNGAIAFGHVWDSFANISIGNMSSPGFPTANRESNTIGIYETTSNADGIPGQGHLSVYGTIKLQGIQTKAVADGILQFDPVNRFQGYFGGQWNTFLVGTCAPDQISFGGVSGVTCSHKLKWDDILGRLLLDNSGLIAYSTPTGGAVIRAVAIPGNASITRILADVFMGTGGGFAAFTGRAARGTALSPAALQTGDEITRVSACGYSGGGTPGYSDDARGYISIFAAEAWTATGQGTRIGLFTTAPGGTLVSEKVRVWGDGGLQIGGTFSASPGSGALRIESHTFVGGTLSVKDVSASVNNIGSTGTGTINIDCRNANQVTMTVTGDINITFSGVSTGVAKTVVLCIRHGGAFNVVFPASIVWKDGTPPALSAVLGVDVIEIITVDGGNTWYGSFWHVPAI